MPEQKRLFDLPIDEDKAREIALLEVRERLGTIPTPVGPRREDDRWVVPIVVRYPRAIYHERLTRPERMRFMDFGEVGTVEIEASSGEIVHRTQFWDVQRRIQDRLILIRNTVEKALVKSSADRFARLAFPEHMQSPVLDLLSWIMLQGELPLSTLSNLVGAEEEKYLGYVDSLQKTGLLTIRNEAVVPTPFFIEIESHDKPLNDRLTDALAFYFARGYEHIEGVRQFVGPQLAVTGFVYEVSLEAERPAATPYSVIESSLVEVYGEQKKVLQLPRYIAQLEGVELLVRTELGGEMAWGPSEGGFARFLEERQVLEPVLTLI